MKREKQNEQALVILVVIVKGYQCDDIAETRASLVRAFTARTHKAC